MDGTGRRNLRGLLACGGEAAPGHVDHALSWGAPPGRRPDRQKAREQGWASGHLCPIQGAEEGDQATHASDPAATSRNPRRKRAWKTDLVGNGLREAAQFEQLWQQVQELVPEGGTAAMQL